MIAIVAAVKNAASNVLPKRGVIRAREVPSDRSGNAVLTIVVDRSAVDQIGAVVAAVTSAAKIASAVRPAAKIRPAADLARECQKIGRRQCMKNRPPSILKMIFRPPAMWMMKQLRPRKSGWVSIAPATKKGANIAVAVVAAVAVAVGMKPKRARTKHAANT